ncbi:hypothetical protein ATANTOWER_015607 [Ataeniobius toweri]|uniref:Uncharacterized protein n=1 Tax=Ataeniobius toweri TaxID=208326 RepID=A0ABU7CDY6_9TELE|nr:hypothetical protein [Ataeniobius toweri]
MSVAVSNQLQSSFCCQDPHNPAMQEQQKTSSDHSQRPDSMSSKAPQARLQTLGSPYTWKPGDMGSLPDRTAGYTVASALKLLLLVFVSPQIEPDKLQPHTEHTFLHFQPQLKETQGHVALGHIHSGAQLNWTMTLFSHKHTNIALHGPSLIIPICNTQQQLRTP